MKKIYILSLILSSSATLFAKEKPDTLINCLNNATLTITESTDGITVRVEEIEGETNVLQIADYRNASTVSTDQSTYHYNAISLKNGAIRMQTSKNWSVISGGFNLGLVNAMGQPDNLNLQWSKSFEIAWVNALAVRYSHKSFNVSLGIGFDWRNYKMTTTSHRMVLAPETAISTSAYPNGATDCFSRIKVFSLGFPLLYTQKIPGTTLSLTAGGILNLNTHASLLSKYRCADGTKVEESAEGIGRRRVSCDLYGAISFCHGTGLYVRYSPQSVLKGHGVPEFNPLSVGITLFM